MTEKKARAATAKATAKSRFPAGMTERKARTKAKTTAKAKTVGVHVSQVSNHPGDEDLSPGTLVKSRPGAPNESLGDGLKARTKATTTAKTTAKTTARTTADLSTSFGAKGAPNSAQDDSSLVGHPRVGNPGIGNPRVGYQCESSVGTLSHPSGARMGHPRVGNAVEFQGRNLNLVSDRRRA